MAQIKWYEKLKKKRATSMAKPKRSPTPKDLRSSAAKILDFDVFRLRMLQISNQEPPENDASIILRSVTLYYTQPVENSDKVYKLEIVKEPKFGDAFYVDFWYGKRGKTLRNGRKTKVAVSYVESSRIFDAIVAEQKSQGYTENISGKPFSR